MTSSRGTLKQTASKPIASISVLIPTYQGMEFLEAVLDALSAQVCELTWDLWVVDSGSNDGTWELLQSRAENFAVPMHLERIHSQEFNHGDTRNRLAARSAGDLLVFLTQDAIPGSPEWLQCLSDNFQDAHVGGATCRNQLRAAADPLTVIFAEHDAIFSNERREASLPTDYDRLSPAEKRPLYLLNDVASAVRREAWMAHPFPRAEFGEDVLMARGLLEAGWKLVCDAQAFVVHSHDYDAATTAKRGELDGRFNAEWLGVILIRTPRDVEISTHRQLELDRAALVKMGLVGTELARQVERAKEMRHALFQGMARGGCSERRHVSTKALGPEQTHSLNLLYVVHGFPPEVWAGTEVYTLNLALAMQSRGHKVTVLARSEPAKDDAGSPAQEGNSCIREDEFQGLRVLRWSRALDFPHLRASYSDEKVDAGFAQLLEREQPDVVHFQHLIHLSAGLVQVAKNKGLATVVHCHDFWALCARVQLIRPDGNLCKHNMGLGCLWCIKDKQPDKIENLSQTGRYLRPALKGLAGAVHGRRHPDQRKRSSGWRRALADAQDVEHRSEFVPAAYATADLLVSPSRFLRTKLLAEPKSPMDPERFVFSPNGMNVSNLQPGLEREPIAAFDSERPLRVGFIGSIVWYKGVDVLVRAAGLLSDAPVEVSIFGDFKPDSPDADAHTLELARLAKTDACASVKFRGRFDNQRLREVHAELDCLVVPSVWFENSPVTIHEAWLLGTPPVVSDLGGMAELVQHGVNGLCFGAGDPQALAEVLRGVLADPSSLERLRAGAPRVKTVDEDAADTEFRYRSLCTRRPGME